MIAWIYWYELRIMEINVVVVSKFWKIIYFVHLYSDKVKYILLKCMNDHVLSIFLSFCLILMLGTSL